MGQKSKAVDPEIAEMLEFYQAAAGSSDAFYEATGSNDSGARGNRAHAGHASQSRQSETSRRVAGQPTEGTWRREYRS